MLLTSVALTTGMLLVGEGCMSAGTMPKPTPMSVPMPTPSATPTPTTTVPDAAEQSARSKEEPNGTRHALVVDAMRGCRVMKTQAGNTKGPSYTDVCVR